MDVHELLAVRTAAAVVVAFFVTVAMAMVIRGTSKATRWIQDVVASSCDTFDDIERVVAGRVKARQVEPKIQGDKPARRRNSEKTARTPRLTQAQASMQASSVQTSGAFANALALRDVGWKVFFVGMYIANLSVIAPAAALFSK